MRTPTISAIWRVAITSAMISLTSCTISGDASPPYRQFVSLRSRPHIDVSGTYTIRATGVDNTALYVDGEPIWSPEGKQGDTSDFEQSVHLDAGDHLIMLDAYAVEWKRPSLSYALEGATK